MSHVTRRGFLDIRNAIGALQNGVSALAAGDETPSPPNTPASRIIGPDGGMDRRSFLKCMAALFATAAAATTGFQPSIAHAAPEQSSAAEPVVPDFQLYIVEQAVANAMRDSVWLYAQMTHLSPESEEAQRNAPLNLFVLMMHFGIAFETGQPVSSLLNLAEFPQESEAHWDQYYPFVTYRPGVNVITGNHRHDANGNPLYDAEGDPILDPVLTEAGVYVESKGYSLNPANLNAALSVPNTPGLPAEIRRPLYFRTMLKHFAGLDDLLVQEWGFGLFS